MQTGILRWYDPAHGRGGIARDGDAGDIFVKLAPREAARAYQLAQGQAVMFEVDHCDRLGRPIATAVRAARSGRTNRL